MQPYLSDPDFQLWNGDACEVLAELPDESVHMCVTSPPFFGLRDYGTGSWDGGDAGCDHLQPSTKVGAVTTLRNDGRAHTGLYENEKAVEPGYPFRDTCGKCGATRVDRQIGLEATPEEWVAQLVAVFEQVRRVLRKDGTLWVECGDSYAHPAMGGTAGSSPDGPRGGRLAETGRTPSTMGPGLKQKDLIGQPFLLAFALREAGWYWRNVLIWHKPNPMPESVRDRFTVSHSYVLLFSKSPRYFFDAEAVREKAGDNTHSRGNGTTPKGAAKTDGNHADGFYEATTGHVTARNARSVWTIATEPLPFEHYAAFPQALAASCIKAGSSEGDTVLDPFIGSGTTALVARRLGRRCVGVELNERYCELAAKRTQQLSLEAVTAEGGTP